MNRETEQRERSAIRERRSTLRCLIIFLWLEAVPLFFFPLVFFTASGGGEEWFNAAVIATFVVMGRTLLIHSQLQYLKQLALEDEARVHDKYGASWFR